MKTVYLYSAAIRTASIQLAGLCFTLWRVNRVFAIVVLGFALQFAAGAAAPARAAVPCPDISSAGTAVLGGDTDTGQCPASTPPVNGFQLAAVAGVSRLLFQKFEAGVSAPPVSVSCPSANTTIVTFLFSTAVEFSAPDTCNFTATFNINGETVTTTGTVNWDGTTMTVTNIVADGEPFCPKPENDEDVVLDRTRNVVSNFMSRRADQITANDPSIVDRLSSENGRTPNKSAGGPVNFAANSNEGGHRMAFSTSLRQVAQANQKAQQKRNEELAGKMALGAGKPDGTVVASKYDIWVEGKWVQIDSLTAKNDLGLLYVGADYRVNSALLIGILGQFDWSDEDDNALGSNVDGRGWMVGPYVAARLHQNLLFDGRAAWGRSSNDVSPTGSFTDSFDTNRWLVKGQLTGDFDVDQWHLAPHVAVTYFEDNQDAFTNSLGTLVGEQTVSLGRVTFGPKISTTIHRGAISVTPFVGLQGIWDFDRTNLVNLSTGLAAGTDEFRGRVEGGASLQMPGGILLKGEGFYDGIGADDFDAYGGGGRLTVPLN